MNRWTRKLHRWGALFCGLPLLLVIVTGLLLQLKKQIPWVQPTTLSGTSKAPEIDFEQILQATRQVAATEVQSWSDISRLDVIPSKGVVKVQCQNRWEVQLNLSDAAVLSSKYRRSDLIESLHDGSFFSDWAKLWIFFPSGLLLLSLWITGAWLWWLPIQSQRKKQIRLAAKKTEN